MSIELHPFVDFLPILTAIRVFAAGALVSQAKTSLRSYAKQPRLILNFKKPPVFRNGGLVEGVGLLTQQILATKFLKSAPPFGAVMGAGLFMLVLFSALKTETCSAAMNFDSRLP